MIPLIKLFVLISIGLINMANAFAFTHEKYSIEKQIIHVVTINPKDYKIEIVRAQGEGMREAVSSIARRMKAEVAINAGFFKISKNRHAIPSGTLVINGYIYNVNDRIQPFLSINSNVVSIKLSNPKENINKNTSIVSGIPLLVKDGEIFEPITQKTSEFYVKPHARTAIGIKSDGTVVVLIVEHNYSRDLSEMTLGEVQSFMKTKGEIFAQEYNRKSPEDLTAAEIKKILKQEFSVPNGSEGLSIVALAKKMKELGCKNAINLDGGGSSTLWIKNKIVNQTIGDRDESEGEQIEREVSDSIVFIKKQIN